MADPFDIANANTPSPDGGISPDVWRNLMAFGAAISTAANARNGQGFLTYGNGFAGPLGAGVQGAMAQNLETAKTRSALGLQNAQMQDVRSQAALRNIQKNQGLYNLNLTSQLYGGPQFDQNGNPLPAGQTSPLSLFPGQQQQGAAPQPSQTPFTGGGQAVANAPDLKPLIAASAQKYGIPEPLATALLQQESSLGTNPAAAGNVGQITFKTANKPGYGMAPLAGADLADPAKNVDFALQYLRKAGDAAGVQNWNDPTQWAAGLRAYNGGGDPNYVQNVARWLPQGTQVGGDRFQVAQAGNGAIPMPSQGGGGQPAQSPLALTQGILQGHIPLGSLTPEQAGAAAPLIGRVDPHLGQALTNFALAGATTSQQERAKALVELQTAGQIARQKAANSNIDARPGALIRTWDAQGHEVWIKNPQLEEVQDATGRTTYAHITPPLPGAPPGTPGESTPVLNAAGEPAVKKLPANLQAARTKAYEDFTGKDTDSYLAAQNTQAWIEQMNHAADAMNAGGGFLGTGPTSQSRLAFANTVNDILRTSGLPNAFDAQKIASWEEYKKATTTAGFELSSHYEGHARQAAQTIINATSAVPSPANSPVGAKLVSAGIQEAAQSAIDLHQFKQDVYNQSGDLGRAEVDFYKGVPAQMYARRAISRVTPYGVANDKELNRYLPGTWVTYKGHVVQVPERPGMPPIPEYLRSGAAPEGGG